jgi:hypothetical protein
MTATTYPTYRTALLSVDPHNDFMSEDAKFYEATRETAESVGFFDDMLKVISAIRGGRYAWPNLKPIRDLLLVSIDLNNFRLTT